MYEPNPFAVQFPRPGRALGGLLWAVSLVWLFWAIAFNWIPGGKAAFEFLTFRPDKVLHGEIWRLLTAGFLLAPTGSGALAHLLFTLVGLYFLSPDLERNWGSRRFLVFIGSCIVLGYGLALVADLLPFHSPMFHPPLLFGMAAAITGTAVAWSRENANLEVRLFFVLPIKGRTLFWLTIAYCVLAVVVLDESTEGVVAPFGGVLAGLLLGGSPSPIRAAYLKWRLSSLQKRAGGLTAASLLEPRATRKAGGPTLRVVQGGQEREPPRDKRYLN